MFILTLLTVLTLTASLTQVNKLAAMGFADLEKNKRALVVTKGDVAAAIEHLVW